MDFIECKAPRSAIAFYIKMYSKQRHQSQKEINIITEAAKSWLSLSEAEKNEFSKKYRECNLLLQKKVANHLKNIKPYLKKKKRTNGYNVTSNCYNDSYSFSDCNINCEQNESQASNHLEENNLHCDQNILSTLQNQNISCTNKDSPQNFDDKRITSSSEHFVNDEVKAENMILPSEVVLHEPNPPALLSGQQLFNMIQKDDVITWADLLPAQKRQYQTAVLSIKKNYLREYKMYLESLSTLNLLEHYKNVKNELV